VLGVVLGGVAVLVVVGAIGTLMLSDRIRRRDRNERVEHEDW
jgi:hypothetical protein